MPRAGRVFVEGGVYHVYNRLGRGERVFQGEEAAVQFVELLRDVVGRDELTVFAWCLMPNHYHMAVRMGRVSLDRPIRSLQQRVTRKVNAVDQVYGPLWQGRYRSKLVEDQRYLDQLLIYIHLNPVTGGMVEDPGEYQWSGHREILGKVKDAIVDVDEVLRVFGRTRRSARAGYARRLRGAVEEEWIGEQPGRLPWWRFGRPPKWEEVDPEDAVRERRKRERLGPEWRPRLKADDLVRRGAEALGVELEDLRSRGRSPAVVRARELLLVVGVERYGVQVKGLAQALGKSADGMTKALARGSRRRCDEHGFAEELDKLDRSLAETAG